jgi:hypothetical protein
MTDELKRILKKEVVDKLTYCSDIWLEGLRKPTRILTKFRDVGPELSLVIFLHLLLFYIKHFKIYSLADIKICKKYMQTHWVVKCGNKGKNSCYKIQVGSLIFNAGVCRYLGW